MLEISEARDKGAALPISRYDRADLMGIHRYRRNGYEYNQP